MSQARARDFPPTLVAWTGRTCPTRRPSAWRRRCASSRATRDAGRSWKDASRDSCRPRAANAVVRVCSHPRQAPLGSRAITSVEHDSAAVGIASVLGEGISRPAPHTCRSRVGPRRVASGTRSTSDRLVRINAVHYGLYRAGQCPHARALNLRAQNIAIDVILAGHVWSSNTVAIIPALALPCTSDAGPHSTTRALTARSRLRSTPYLLAHLATYAPLFYLDRPRESAASLSLRDAHTATRAITGLLQATHGLRLTNALAHSAHTPRPYRGHASCSSVSTYPFDLSRVQY